jgi:hypothetical protein
MFRMMLSAVVVNANDDRPVFFHRGTVLVSVAKPLAFSNTLITIQL